MIEMTDALHWVTVCALHYITLHARDNYHDQRESQESARYEKHEIHNTKQPMSKQKPPDSYS